MPEGEGDGAPRVLIQPAAGTAAREHYRKTIAEPVPMARIEAFLSEDEREDLIRYYPGGEFFIWGLTPGAGGRGRTKWEQISRGDVALFSWSNKFRSRAKVTAKSENADLARELWGTDDDGNTWQYLYFLTKPLECNVPYEEFNRIVGYKPNNVPQGFNVLDEERSEALLREYPELADWNRKEAVLEISSAVREAFELFRNDRVESLRVRVRQHRAAEVRALLADGRLDPATFDTEVWQIAAEGKVDGEEFAGHFDNGAPPPQSLLDRIESALESGGLKLHGNYHWRPATSVFGAQFDEERRKQSVERAIGVLNDGTLGPLEQYRALLTVDGFGPSTASGLVMLMHPRDFGVYNSKSKEAIRGLGGAVESIDEFQRSTSDLRAGLSAHDFSELDRFLYLAAEDRIFVPGVIRDCPRAWWVNQGSTYREGSTGGYVWAPVESQRGTRVGYHENVARLCLGDRILHYAGGALRAVGTAVGSPVIRKPPASFPAEDGERKGFYARVDHASIPDPIELTRIPEEWRLEEHGPFNRTGGVKQGYLFSLSEDFARKLAGKFPEIGEHFPPVPSLRNGPVPAEPDLAAACADFSSRLREAGLTFGADSGHDAFVRDFVVSLATKQLVILTGLSGSGKTQIALQFGRWLGGEEGDRYTVVPVRPDWTGSEALFGYPDALQPRSEDGRRAWHVPEALRFMLRAARDPDWPYLMVLDEMNLAHVERYFADVISGMESGEGCLPNVRPDSDGTWREVGPGGGPEKIRFPSNLFIAGTVNVDETTYMFSPKVLDRANTMEFRVETGDLSADVRKPGECAPGEPSLVRGFLEIARDRDRHRDRPAEDREVFVEHLKELHRSLDQGFSFGHRVLYEAVRFAALHREADGGAVEEALDVQVLQKILPRLHGSRRRLEPVLRSVGKFCWDLEPGEGGADGFDPVDPPDPEAGPALPRSFDKVRRMTERLRTNQFVSFTE